MSSVAQAQGPATSHLIPPSDPDAHRTPEDTGLPTARYYQGGTPVVNCHAITRGRVSQYWVRYTHFNGNSYYYDYRHRILTTADITNERLYKKYEDALMRINDRISNIDAYSMHVQTIIIKDVDNPESSATVIVDWKKMSYIEPFTVNAEGNVCIEYKTANFWAILEAFPMHLSELPPGINADFLGALTFGATERILEWDETIYPYTDDQTRRLMQVYRELKSELDKGTAVLPALCWHIACTMTKIENSRRTARFGTPDFSLYRDVVADAVGPKVKMADMCLGVVLFGAHRMYRIRLQSVRVKGVVYLENFRELLRTLLAEWSDSNLLATVFVGANIAFLAVPDINGIQRTASLCSTLFSLVSVATGVYHVWQHRAKLDASAEDARNYMARYQPTEGKEHDADLVIIACFLSVPLVTLLYAVLWFSVALSAYCIQSSDVHGRILLSVVLGILCFAAFSTVIFFWYAWRGRRTVEVSEDDIMTTLEQGWRQKGRNALLKFKKFTRRKWQKGAKGDI